MDDHLPQRNGTLHAAPRPGPETPPPPSPPPILRLRPAGPQAVPQAIIERQVGRLKRRRRQLAWSAFWCLAWALFLVAVFPDGGPLTWLAASFCGVVGGGLIGLRLGLGSTEAVLALLLRRERRRP